MMTHAKAIILRLHILVTNQCKPGKTYQIHVCAQRKKTKEEQQQKQEAYGKEKDERGSQKSILPKIKWR